MRPLLPPTALRDFRRAAAPLLLAAILALVPLTGCTVGPDYRRPEVSAPAETFAQTGEGWKVATPRADVPRGNWWTLFGDPELDRLEARGMEANQDLKAACARFDQARATADVARSGLFPRISVSALPLVQHDSANRPVGGEPGKTYDVYTIPFDLEYELDLWGRVRRSVESATAQTLAVSADIESVRLAIQAEIAGNYFALRALDTDKALVLSTLEVYRRSLALTRNRRAGGMVSDLDVAEAETVLRTAEAQLPQIALLRVRFQNALAVLTGDNPSSFRMPEQPLDTGPVFIPPGLPSELLERRPDIAAAEYRVMAANAAIGASKAAFFPTIRFAGFAGLQSGDMASLVNWPSRAWAVGPSVTLPVFRGGELTADLKRARATHEETVARYRQTVLNAFGEVENHLAAQRLLADEIDAVASALAAARRQLEIANNRYVAGLVTYLEVATAQNTVLITERSSVHLRGLQLVATVALVKSLGGGWNEAEASASVE